MWQLVGCIKANTADIWYVNVTSTNSIAQMVYHSANFIQNFIIRKKEII